VHAGTGGTAAQWHGVAGDEHTQIHGFSGSLLGGGSPADPETTPEAGFHPDAEAEVAAPPLPAGQLGYDLPDLPPVPFLPVLPGFPVTQL